MIFVAKPIGQWLHHHRQLSWQRVGSMGSCSCFLVRDNRKQQEAAPLGDFMVFQDEDTVLVCLVALTILESQKGKADHRRQEVQRSTMDYFD